MGPLASRAGNPGQRSHGRRLVVLISPCRRGCSRVRRVCRANRGWRWWTRGGIAQPGEAVNRSRDQFPGPRGRSGKQRREGKKKRKKKSKKIGGPGLRRGKAQHGGTGQVSESRIRRKGHRRLATNDAEDTRTSRGSVVRWPCNDAAEGGERRRERKSGVKVTGQTNGCKDHRPQSAKGGEPGSCSFPQPGLGIGSHSSRCPCSGAGAEQGTTRA